MRKLKHIIEVKQLDGCWLISYMTNGCMVRKWQAPDINPYSSVPRA